MACVYHVGQRVSFKSVVCTVRYIGPVEGTDKIWLGVEWDDPNRGKHNGENNGKRYFHCLSSAPTAASFVAITRKPDPEQSFVEAVREKYATDITNQPISIALDKAIEISGKTVEEVGFEKIKQQQSQLHELKIVLVDGYRISKSISNKSIKDVCPRIVDVDLSRNLFEDYAEVIQICKELENLQSLRLNGNRMRFLSEQMENALEAFRSIKSLELDEMFIAWEDIRSLVPKFVSLSSLTASSNAFTTIPSGISAHNLKSLSLEYNHFKKLSDILPLRDLLSLESLHLKGNNISQYSVDGLVFGTQLRYVDLSYNQVTTWSFVDALSSFFPGMTALRFSHNPIYDEPAKETGTAVGNDDAYMLTLARLGNLKILNFSTISDEERRNAEMFYLSRIGQAMAKVPKDSEETVTSQHKRYAELSSLHGPPIAVRNTSTAANPDFLEARLIKFTFYMLPSDEEGQSEVISQIREIPKAFDVYRVKGIVGRLFGVWPLSLKLIWETGEWDPVAGYEDEEDDNDDCYGEDERLVESKSVVHMEKGKWVKREVEIGDSTRQVGFCIDGIEAVVRVELQ